jgi:hypothetical protein
LRIRNQVQCGGTRLGTALVLGLAAVAACAMPATQASAGDGGTSISGSTGGGSGSGSCGDATLVDGLAQAPDCAPRRIKLVIDAANDIAKGTDYCYGGGHAKFKSRCYDCSGSVSYALHGGRFIDTPMDSSGFMQWARHGKGDWFTVYASPSHAFLVIAGLRFDTSDTHGAGPGWARSMGAESPRDYRHRHKGRF